MTLAPSVGSAAMPPSPALSAAIREGSAAEHEAAEGSGFMTELLGGRVSEEGYVAYLLRLRAVYEALERVGADQAGDPLVDAVRDPALERLARLDADLAVWAPGQRTEVRSEAADTYVERVEHSASWGGLFLAHHYTRYLGDLSGGQAIGRILQRTYGRGAEGVAFYAFPEVAKPKPYKDAYRARLDAAGLDEAEVARVVGEVRVAFGLNQALFDELGTDLDRYRRVPA